MPLDEENINYYNNDTSVNEIELQDAYNLSYHNQISNQIISCNSIDYHSICAVSKTRSEFSDNTTVSNNNYDPVSILQTSKSKYFVRNENETAISDLG